MPPSETKPNTQLFPCTEPGCENLPPYKRASALGIHKRAAHGIIGTSATARMMQEKKTQLETKPKRKYTKRSTALVKDSQNALVPNHNEQTPHGGNHHLETIASVACGRCQQIIENLSFTYDLPPKSLTAFVIRALGESTKIW